MLERYGDAYPQVHPLAYVHRAAVVIGDVVLGSESSVWPHVTIRGDDGPIRIGAQSSVQDGTVVHLTEGRSRVDVGDRVTVGHNAIVHGCTIEDDCIIGMGAILLDNAVVERGCIVGAGALVPPGKRVPAGSVVVGNPFKVLRQATPHDIEFIAFSWREYVQRTGEYRRRDADGSSA